MEPVRVWRSPKVEVRESHLGGLAVFANAPIAKDEPVAVKVGHVVGFDEVQRLTAEIGDFCLQTYFRRSPVLGSAAARRFMVPNMVCIN